MSLCVVGTRAMEQTNGLSHCRAERFDVQPFGPTGERGFFLRQRDIREVPTHKDC